MVFIVYPGNIDRSNTINCNVFKHVEQAREAVEKQHLHSLPC